GSIDRTSRSLRPASRSRICKPVVPASPSMKTVWVMASGIQTKRKGSSVSRSALSETRVFARGLALRELEAASGLGLAVLLPLHDAAVAGEQAVRLKHAAQLGLVVGQRLGDAVTDRAGL